MSVQENDYSNIIEWVENAFGRGYYDYDSLGDLMNAVKKDFEDNGHYFPMQAEAGIVDSWVRQRGDISVSQYMYQTKIDEDRRVAEEMLGGTLNHGLNDEMVDSLNNPVILGIDTSTIVPERPEPTTAQEAMSGNNKGMIDNYQLEARLRQDIGETKSFFGRLARGLRGKRYRYY